MTEPKTPEDWQHAAERWEAAHNEMMAAAGRWQTAAEGWKQAHDTVRDQRDLTEKRLERTRVEALRAWDQAEHERQRADHNDQVATFVSRQRDHILLLLTPEQHATLGRMMAEDAVR